MSPGRADPDSASGSCKHQVRQDWTGPAKMQGDKDPVSAAGTPWFHQVFRARSPQLCAEVMGQRDMGDTQTPTGRPSTPGKPGKPCKEPHQSQGTRESPPPPHSPACPPGMFRIPSVWYPARALRRGRNRERAPKALQALHGIWE